MLKLYIKSLLKESFEQMDEAIYPENFNIEEFKSLPSFKARIEYAEERLNKLGAGSSRIVYKIDDETVLKLAKNKKGIAQNELEIEYGSYYDLKDIVAEVYEYDENSLWLEMELARKMNKSDFQRIVGVPFEEYASALDYYYSSSIKPSRYYKPSKPDNYDEFWDNDFIRDIFEYMGNYEIPSGDLRRVSTYGIVKRNGNDTIVLIDYGLNDSVYQTYYAR